MRKNAFIFGSFSVTFRFKFLKFVTILGAAAAPLLPHPGLSVIPSGIPTVVKYFMENFRTLKSFNASSLKPRIFNGFPYKSSYVYLKFIKILTKLKFVMALN